MVRGMDDARLADPAPHDRWQGGGDTFARLAPAPDNRVASPLRLSGPWQRDRHLFRHLQALDDAIAYRSDRIAHLCPDCSGDGRCDDHACDVALIRGYQEDAQEVIMAIVRSTAT